MLLVNDNNDNPRQIGTLLGFGVLYFSPLFGSGVLLWLLIPNKYTPKVGFFQLQLAFFCLRALDLGFGLQQSSQYLNTGMGCPKP